MNEVNPLNIPAYQRKRSLAAKSRAIGRKTRPTKTTIKRVKKLPEPSANIPAFEDPYTIDEIEPTTLHQKKSFREMKLCGRCDGYFDKIDVAIVQVTSALRIGDQIIFQKDQGLFEITIESMQIDRKDVSLAHAGSDIGLKVPIKPDVGTPVYKVI